MARVKQCALLATLLLFASFQVTYGGRICPNGEDYYCITVTAGNNVMKFQLNATENIGWVGVGIGNSMIGSYLVMAWPTNNGFAISHRQAGSRSVPSVQSAQVEAENASGGIRDGRFIVEFQRPFEVEGSTVGMDTRDFIYAASNSDSKSLASDSMDLSQHDYRGQIKIDLRTGESSETEDPNRRKFVAHGVLMFLSWAFTMPLAAGMARFGRRILPKQWFWLHVGIQLFVTTPLVIIGFVYGYYASGKQFNKKVAHQVFGVFLMVALFVQIVLGEIHHKLFDPKRQYIPWWTKVHWWWGRVIFLAALVQIPMGMKRFKEVYKLSYGLFVGYYVYISLLVVAFTIGIILVKRKVEPAKTDDNNVPYRGVLLNSNDA